MNWIKSFTKDADIPLQIITALMFLFFIVISVFPAKAGRKVKGPTLSRTSVKLDAGKNVRIKVKKDEGKKALIPKVENVLDIYSSLQTAEEKNNLLKTIVKKVEYLKCEKAIKKDSDPTNFELDIYPNIG